MVLRLLVAWTFVCSLALSGSGCGRSIDIAEAVVVDDVFSGWYDFGVIGGLNKLVPSISFRLRNTADVPVSNVQLIVSFWQTGADGENDSREVRGIGSDAVAPGASSEPILVRSDVGYTLAQPRAELFTHRDFKDFVAKIFGKRGGRIVPLGEFTIERRIIPQVSKPAP
jgi:hypothetical protein